MGIVIIILLFGGGLLVVLALWTALVYNGLIRLRNQVDEGWSDIDVQLKRRHDLIPNLINTAKGYLKHEAELLQNITEARSQAITAQETGNASKMAQSENMLSGLIGKFQIAVEAYPDLKANQTMAQLMDELADTENKIQAARRFFNGVVRDFNTKLQVFPNNIIAGMLGFNKRDFFEIEDEKEKANPEVKF